MPFFLTIDPENVLEPILEEYAPLFGFTYAKAALEHPHDALLIVENKEIKDIFTYLHQLVPEKKSPICVIVSKTNSAKDYRILKTELHIDYVLQSPINKEEIAALLRKLCHLDEQKQGEQLPPELVEKYTSTIFDKIETIEQQIKDIEDNYKSKDSLVALRNTVHKIAGSAGAYGFAEAGRLCKAEELFLYDLYSADVIATPQKEIDATNQRFFRQVRLAFQNIILKKETALGKKKTAPGEEEKANVEAPSTLFLSLVSTDLSLVRLFQKIAAQRQLAIEIESDPKLYLEKWKESKNHPQALIIEEYFPFTSYTGLEVIQTLKEAWKNHGVTYGLITQVDDLEKRMQWLSQGIDLILKKPLTQENIASLFDQISIKPQLRTLKALIVDDDEDVGLIEKSALEQMGIEAHYLEDETRLIKTLESIDPDLLLLDINLPRYNGKELLRTLRADVRFRNLIIIVVTVIQEESFIQWAYAANCDEVIGKPIDVPHLQSRILNLIQRHRSLQSRARLDPTTGLYPKDYFLSKVNDVLSRSLGLHAAFTILKIDLWESLSSVLAPLEVKDLLIQLAELIKVQFIKSSLVGYLGEGSFGLLFLNQLGGEVEFLMNAFYDEIKKKVLITGKESVKASMSSVTSVFGVGKISIGSVIESTQKALAKLQEEGESHLKIQRLTEGPTEVQKRHIVIVDDDKDLCDVVVYAFKNHGFTVDFFNTGEEAINYFARLEKLDENTLVILDRILPDRDGLTLLHLIQEKFPGKIKAIFLSSLSTEKDILEGLKLGALDYVTKPFSISVLLQKALVLLNQ